MTVILSVPSSDHNAGRRVYFIHFLGNVIGHGKLYDAMRVVVGFNGDGCSSWVANDSTPSGIDQGQDHILSINGKITSAMVYSVTPWGLSLASTEKAAVAGLPMTSPPVALTRIKITFYQSMGKLHQPWYTQ